MNNFQFPISSAVFDYWFQERLARSETIRGTKAYLDATYETYAKLHAFDKTLEGSDRKILRELLAIGFAFDQIQFDDIDTVYRVMQSYEKGIQIAIKAVNELESTKNEE